MKDLKEIQEGINQYALIHSSLNIYLLNICYLSIIILEIDKQLF